MTQFKFRGRRPNGEWVYGAYIPPEYTQLGYASIVTKEHRFEVDPESVGIFIGRTADGEEIYSGSQLEFSWNNKRMLYNACCAHARKCFMTTRQILFLLILFNILCWVAIIYGCYLLWR